MVHSAAETENLRLFFGRKMTTVGHTGSGGGHTITICKTCGVQIYSHYYGNKKVLVLKTTSFDNDDLYSRKAHTFYQRRIRLGGVEQQHSGFR